VCRDAADRGRLGRFGLGDPHRARHCPGNFLLADLVLERSVFGEDSGVMRRIMIPEVLQGSSKKSFFVAGRRQWQGAC
jgi:hypothetical protein